MTTNIEYSTNITSVWSTKSVICVLSIGIAAANANTFSRVTQTLLIVEQ